MSHFSVLIIGDNVEEQLAPYQENNMEDCPKEYLKFNEVETEYKKEYENDGVEMIKTPDGELIFKWDDRFRKSGEFGLGSNTHEVPENQGYEKVYVPHKERYPNFETFIEEWAGYEKDEELGLYGYWENPNAKWDWYLIGGRWTGFFKLKDGTVGNVGKPGIMTSPAKIGYADQVCKCDIDFEGMRQECREKAEVEWEEIRALLGDSINSHINWEKVREEMFPGNIQDARTFYNNQESVKATYKVIGPFNKVENYLCTKEEFVNKKINSAISTFAVIKDSKWYERGSMGWWGIVIDEKDKEKWNTEFNNLIDSLSEDTLFTIVDCHI